MTKEEYNLLIKKRFPNNKKMFYFQAVIITVSITVIIILRPDMYYLIPLGLIQLGFTYLAGYRTSKLNKHFTLTEDTLSEIGRELLIKEYKRAIQGKHRNLIYSNLIQTLIDYHQLKLPDNIGIEERFINTVKVYYLLHMKFLPYISYMFIPFYVLMALIDESITASDYTYILVGGIFLASAMFIHYSILKVHKKGYYVLDNYQRDYSGVMNMFESELEKLESRKTFNPNNIRLINTKDLISQYKRYTQGVRDEDL